MPSKLSKPPSISMSVVRRLIPRITRQPLRSPITPGTPITPRTSFVPRIRPREPPYRSYASGHNPTPGRSPFRVWPFVFITLAGSGAYVYILQSRAGKADLLPSPISLPPSQGATQLPKTSFILTPPIQHQTPCRPFPPPPKPAKARPSPQPAQPSSSSSAGPARAKARNAPTS